MFLENVFTTCSLLSLALLSLERLHATLFPFRHCLMLDWVYFKAVVCIWFIAVISASAGAALFLIAPKASQYVWASLIIAVLFTVIVSYAIIALNVKRKAPPYSSGAVSSDRKLTVTLLVVIVLSTVAILPWFFNAVLEVSTRLRGLSAEARFDIRQSLNVFFYANSFVNPLVYTLRMKEFRKATRVWRGSVNTVGQSQIIEMNTVTGWKCLWVTQSLSTQRDIHPVAKMHFKNTYCDWSLWKFSTRNPIADTWNSLNLWLRSSKALNIGSKCSDVQLASWHFFSPFFQPISHLQVYKFITRNTKILFHEAHL